MDKMADILEMADDRRLPPTSPIVPNNLDGSDDLIHLKQLLNLRQREIKIFNLLLVAAHGDALLRP